MGNKLHLLKIDYLAAIMLHVLHALSHTGFVILLYSPVFTIVEAKVQRS